MPNRIASINVDGVSVWDVLFPMKTGQVDPDHDFADYHKEMLSAALDRPVEDLSEFTWLESMQTILPWFQERVKSGETPFTKIRSLYFVKLGLNRRNDGSHWISFQTEFHDPNVDEQAYIADMHAHYGQSLEVFWRHAEGVDVLFDPPDQPTLAESFLKLVDECKIDNQGDALCFFVQDPTVGPDRVKAALADSDRLLKVAEIVREMRQRFQEPDADHRALLAEMIERVDASGAD